MSQDNFFSNVSQQVEEPKTVGNQNSEAEVVTNQQVAKTGVGIEAQSFKVEVTANQQVKTIDAQIPNADVEEETNEIKIGIVANCNRLNIRKEPNASAEIVCEVVCKAELMVDEKESTDEFYKVCTATGMNGFCMKNFITVQP